MIHHIKSLRKVKRCENGAGVWAILIKTVCVKNTSVESAVMVEWTGRKPFGCVSVGRYLLKRVNEPF